MAIPYTKDDSYSLVCKQAAWGTGIAGTAGFTTPTGFIVDCEPMSFDGDHKERRPNRSQASKRHLDTVNYTIDNKAASPKASFAGELKYNDAAHILYSVVQNVSESASTPYTKTFTYSTTQPDHVSAAGWFATLAKLGPTAAQSQAIIDAIGRQVRFSCVPGDRLRYAWDLMGRGAMDYDYDLSSPGTHTRSAAEYFHFEDLTTFSINSVGLYAMGIEITLNNNAIPASVTATGSGNFRQFALGTGNGYETLAKLRVQWDGNAQDLQQELESAPGQPRAIDIAWGTAGQDGHLRFQITGVLRKAPDVEGDIKEVEFDFVGVQNASNAPLTITLSDAVDRAW